MDLALQAWGGGLYLLNKIFFAVAEGQLEANQRKLRMAGWLVYIFGVPAWVIILVGKHDWIAASIQVGVVPSMLFGLYNAFTHTERPNKTFDRIASLCTCVCLALGGSYSLYDYGGLTAVSQILELCIMVGFLVGSYLLAKKNLYGWLFFILMNACMGTLMLLQHKPLLSAQQLLSLCFVVYGFSVALKYSRRRAR
jgi:nicotinamide riboside transporter PnuC